MPSVAVPEVSNGTVTASSAATDKVAVIVTAAPSSPMLEELALKLTVGALSLSVIVIVVLVPELAVDAEPPLTEPMLTVAVSDPS